MKRPRKKQAFAFSITLFLLLYTLSLAHSENFKLRQFALYATPKMEKQNCQLTERAPPSAVASTTKFQGHMENNRCNVSIPKKRYEQLFQFCYQSGINLHKVDGEHSFECFIQERENDYLFLTYISPKVGTNSQVICYFSCMTPTHKMQTKSNRK
jgi:hypothetical protein